VVRPLASMATRLFRELLGQFHGELLAGVVSVGFGFGGEV
jgi:hypothetical protein